MKKNLFYSFFISLVLLITSCGDMLDLQPYAAVSTDNFYKTAADAEKAVTAAYSQLMYLDGQNGTQRAGYCVTGDVTSSDVQGHPDIVVYYQIQQSIVPTTSNHVLQLYQRCYAGLLMANIALEKIPDIDMDATLKNRYLGELYFLRGFWMFRLGQFYGTAPVVTKVLALDELDLPNSQRVQTRVAGKSVNNLQITKSDLFDQAEKDFKQALTLGLANRNTGALLGRADNGSVKAYLAHLYLYQHRWQEAKSLLEDIMGYGYALLPDYNHLFDGGHDNNIESVFEVQFAAMNQKATDNFGTMVYAPNAEGYVIGGGWGWTRPTEDIVREYEEGDPRLVASLFRKGIDDFFGQVFVDRVNGTGYGFRKWCLIPAQGATVDIAARTTSANYPLVRYPDILLWYAEVLNELGDQAGAARHVNMVRKRTGTTPNPNTVNVTPVRELDPISETMNYEQMFWAIFQERRIEFAFEGKFGWDLRRWGVARQFLKDPNRWQNQRFGDYFKYEDNKDEILPIPQLEIDRSPGGLLQQNPGYPK